MLTAALVGCAAGKGAESKSQGALAGMSDVVHRLTAEVGGDWKQHVAPSTGPCSTGGTQRGLEWADDWDGERVDLARALDVGERILMDAGFETERQPGPYGARVHGSSADGRSILLDIGNNGEALLDARSACFPDPDAGS